MDHLRANGFRVKPVAVEDTGVMRKRLGIPEKLGGCHTALIEGYAVEGHVPAREIRRLLAQRSVQLLAKYRTGQPIDRAQCPLHRALQPIIPEYDIILIDCQPSLGLLTVNAFVAAGLNMFFNTGLLLRVEHPGQLIGVIAHESGHIAGGHLARLRDELPGEVPLHVVPELFTKASGQMMCGASFRMFSPPSMVETSSPLATARGA